DNAMTKKRERIDRRSPEAYAKMIEIVRATFVHEGTMVAFPLCFPGATVPIVADESHITALDTDPHGIVYGGTSGRAAHLFSASFRGSSGVVFDLGAVEGADECVAVCCGDWRTKRFVACVNGPGGGRVVALKYRRPAFDLIQEWGFRREPHEDLGEVVSGEKIVHAVADPSRKLAIGVTKGHLFAVNIADSKVEVVAEIPGTGRVAVGSNGSVFGLDEEDALWRYDPAERTLARKAVKLPEGSWNKPALRWAKDPVDGKLYTADGEARLYSFSEEEGF
ncbi:unnamed protein product, partial [marine sediment metagenome]